MSVVVGCDFSTKAVDLVRLDEDGPEAAWHRVEPAGKIAFDRLCHLAALMPAASWWEDVYLFAIEIPYGKGQPGTQAKLNRVLGAVVATVPRHVKVWAVRPGEWRHELGVPGNAKKGECAHAVAALYPPAKEWPYQDALDAYAIAYAAREINARAIANALEEDAA